MKIAYLTNCFGIQSHTFIRREIAELNKLGIEVALFGIHEEISDRLTASERTLVNKTTYLYPLRVLQIVWLNLRWLVFRPGRYFAALKVAVTNGERKPAQKLKLIYHFFIAAYLADAMEKARVEHIHAHFLNVSSTMAMYASLLSGIPYSVTVHSAGTRNAPHIIGIPQKLRHAQFLMMISRYNIDYFDDIYPCRDKAIVVRCGMDLQQYPYRKPVSIAAADTVLPVSILAVGRFVEKKGFRYLIEAMALLRDRQVPATLEILGSGPLDADLRRRVKNLQLDDVVSFFGPASTDDVRTKMLGASVVAVPSVTGASGEMEGIPVVLMEAMALGVPVVSTRHSGIPELVRDGDTGLIVDEKDVVALASALQSFADTTRIGERVRRIENARKLIETEFNISVVAEQRRKLFLEQRHEMPLQYRTNESR